MPEEKKSKHSVPTLHLVKGEIHVEWHDTEQALRKHHRVFPPQSQGGCELRAPTSQDGIPSCENVSCNGRCVLNGVYVRDEEGGHIYWWCECR